MKSTFASLHLVLCVALFFSFSVSELKAQSERHQIIDEHPGEHHLLPQSSTSVTALQNNEGTVPGGFSFQAVARDADGEVLVTQELAVKVNILKDGDSGETVYTETHETTSSESGLINLVIGDGNSEDDFDAIDWASGSFYVKLSADPDGGSNYEALGTTRLLSVPYALVAKDVLGDSSVFTEYNLDTAEGDTSFIINSTGPGGLTALRVNADTEGSDETPNIGISGNALSESSNTAQQRAIQGIASGEGAGTHYGLFGSAVNHDATSGNRIAVYGQAVSSARYNYGTLGVAQGSGDGTIVPIGDENGEDAFGSFNIGGGFYTQGNSNGNLGVEGVVSGSEGERINIGVEGRVTATASAPNIGLNARSSNSPVENIGVSAHADGPEGSWTVGVRGSASGDGDNYAGWFDGRVQVNGDISYTGELNQTSDRNLKENIRPIQNALSTIMHLNPATYNFRGNGEYKGMSLSTRNHFGLIAQEVEDVLPELVKVNHHRYKTENVADAGPSASAEGFSEEIMEYKSLNYTEMIPILIKAMQEQQAEIDRLQRELQALKEDR